MQALIIGGTRNLGPSLVRALIGQGHQVAVLNRGITPGELPPEVEQLRADRSDPQQMRATLGKRAFDVVVDTTLYTGIDAEATIELLTGRVGRYVFLSTGQVYLVRTGLKRPFREQDYSGEVMEAPPESQAFEYRNWLYGDEKRKAEDALLRAWQKHGFPFTSLRLPMVNSERDHYDRIYGYFLRLRDGGPVVAPQEVNLPLRHVYGEDVCQAVLRLLSTDSGRGEAYNISQDESVSLDDFLSLMAEILGSTPEIVRVPRARLEEAGLLPASSPFSDPWMSALDNQLSKQRLGMDYTPLIVYLKKLLQFFASQPLRKIPSYSDRVLELEMAASFSNA